MELEVLLGGVVEDTGFRRVPLNSDQHQSQMIDNLMEDATNVELEDELVRIRDCRVDDVPMIHYRNRKGQERKLLFSPWALTQFCNKIGMNASGYMIKCIRNNMGYLVPSNINEWITQQVPHDKEVYFRRHKDTLRAVVSDRYGVFNHTDVVECLQDSIKENGLKVDSVQMTPDNLSLRVVAPEKVIVPGGGGNDGSSVGIAINNGQTGQVILGLEFMTYTFVCSNGLFIGTDRSLMFRRKHFSINKEDFRRDFLTAIEKFPTYIAAQSGILEKARQTRLTQVFRTEEDQNEFLQKNLKLSEDGVEDLNYILHHDWDNTLWGLSGAVTQYAQLVSNSVRQTQLERIAGKIIEDGLKIAA
jgi:hypothetical protein